MHVHDLLPPAAVVSFEPHHSDGIFAWGSEIHATFSRDPGPVWLEYADGTGSGHELVGSGTLRAFFVVTSPFYLAWGDGESYDVGVQRVLVVDRGPILMGTTPDVDRLAFRAEILDATDITLACSGPIGPPTDDDPERLLQLWEVKSVEFENMTTGETWVQAHTVHGSDMTVLRTERNPHVPSSSYALRAVIGDVFGGVTVTLVDIRFATE